MPKSRIHPYHGVARTVNPWLDHRHDTRPSGYWRSARSPDERSDIRGFLVHPRISLRSCELLATCIADNSFRIYGARRPLKRHPQGPSSDPATRPRFFETPTRSNRSSGRTPCAFKRSSHVEKLDFADPDPVPRFERNAAGRTARFTRRRLYRRAAVQPRVPVLYGLVLPGIVGPAPRGTRDQRRGAGRTGNRTDRTRGPPACGKTCRAGCPPRAARRQGGVERQGAQRQGVDQQEDRRSQSRTSSAGQGMPPATAAVTPEKAVGETVAAIQKPEPKVESAGQPAQTAAITAPRPAEATASKVPAPEVKPEAKAEVVLPPPATLDVAAAPAAPTPAMAASKAREIGKAASASPDDPDNLVALVLTRPEINSLSDLNNKTIAITEKQSASSGRVSAALMAAGAAEVQFSEVKVQRDRPADQRRSPGRRRACLARSSQPVSRGRGIPDFSGAAFDQGAAVASRTRMRDLSAGSLRSVAEATSGFLVYRAHRCAHAGHLLTGWGLLFLRLSEQTNALETASRREASRGDRLKRQRSTSGYQSLDKIKC